MRACPKPPVRQSPAACRLLRCLSWQCCCLPRRCSTAAAAAVRSAGGHKRSEAGGQLRQRRKRDRRHAGQRLKSGRRPVRESAAGVISCVWHTPQFRHASTCRFTWLRHARHATFGDGVVQLSHGLLSTGSSRTRHVFRDDFYNSALCTPSAAPGIDRVILPHQALPLTYPAIDCAQSALDLSVYHQAAGGAAALLLLSKTLI